MAINGLLICRFLVALSVLASVAPLATADDPWPYWGRTSTRLSNTNTFGPRTPTIDWLIQFDFHQSDTSKTSSCVLDTKGRLFVGTQDGITAIDSASRSVTWTRTGGDWVNRTPSVVGDHLFWGETAPRNTFHCTSAAAGDDLWTIQAPAGMGTSPVADTQTGLIFFRFGDVAFLARRMSDGKAGWTTPIEATRSPSLDDDGVLVTGTRDGLARLHCDTGELLWLFPSVELLAGTLPIVDDRVYVGTNFGRNLYAVNRHDGSQIWQVALDGGGGNEAIGHDGTIYAGHSAGRRGLSAWAPDGQQIWFLDLEGGIGFAPVVDGDGTIYATAWNSSPNRGWVHAIRPDSSEVWTKVMPNQCTASPMLAPDGTLYIVCRDKNLYAFRDPHVRATITNLQTTTGEILEGGIEELGEVDELYLHTRSGFGNRLSDLHKMELVVSARVSDPQPEIMRIQIKSKIDEPTGTARISLRNWQTGELETIRTYNIGLDDPFEWIQIPEGGNAPYVDPERYIGPGGAIEMQLKHTVFVPFLAFTFESFIDQIKIEVTG